MSRWFHVILTVTVLLAGAAESARAFPFPVTDVRGLGMGGAYVAEGTGVSAVNYNPAGLARGSLLEFALPANARVQDHIDVLGFLDDMDSLLGDQSFDAWVAANAGNPAELDRMVALIVGLDRPGENSVDLTANGLVGVSFQAFGIAVGIGYAQEIVGSMVTDMDAVNVVTSNPLDPNFIINNDSRLKLYGVEARQLVITGAKEFNGVFLGANLRQISGTSYFADYLLFDETGVEVGDITNQNEKDVSATAIDLGAQFDLVPTVRAGVVARNVNGPSFDLPGGGGKLELDPRLRAGVAVTLPVVTLVADVDLTTTESFSGAESREMALGAELALPVVKLRTGVSRNTALDGAPTVIHAGLGLSLLAMKIDLGGAFESDGRDYSAGASFSLKF